MLWIEVFQTICHCSLIPEHHPLQEQLNNSKWNSISSLMRISMTELSKSGVSRWEGKIQFRGGLEKIGAFRGWASHTNGVYKQQKTILQSTIANLDMDAKSR
jgi:hypothetical protein